jgi:hypothetical protein
MKLEEQVTSLELSKKLKDLGVKQESAFYWERSMFTDGWELKSKERASLKGSYEIYSAFTVAELGEMLPRVIQDKWFLRTKPVKNGNTAWSVQYVGKRGKEMTFRYSRMADPIQGNTEANARAKMLIYLLENDLLSAKQQNLQGKYNLL